MIPNLKPYPKYKDSGVAWLGKVPKHWEVHKIKNIAEVLVSNVDKHSQENEKPVRLCNYIDVYKNDRIFNSRPFMRATASPEEIRRYRLHVKDVIITKDSEIWNDIGVPALVMEQSDDLICGYHLALLRSRNDKLIGDFLFRAIQSKNISYQFHVEANGVTRYGLSHSAIKSLKIPVPAISEQTAIARFLDYYDRKINRFIRKRRRLIELLNEYKQAIINQYVTGKIDPRTGKPYPRYKPSGVDWLGDVPEHWEVLKIKRIARIDPSRSAIAEMRNSNEEVVFLPMERISKDGEIDSSERKPIHELWQGFTYFRRGDVVVAKITPCFENGKGACLKTLPTKIGFGTTELIVLSPSEKVLADYLYEITMLTDFRFLGAQSMTGAAGQQRVSPNFISNFFVPVPPEDDQVRVINFIGNFKTKFKILIDAAQREIALIREFRTRLIADVVTGKVDVREAAKNLPEEPEEEIETMDEEAEPEETPEVSEDKEAAVE